MKKLQCLYFSIPFLGLFVLFSCSEEIQPSTDGKQTAVVFATLNEKDTLHYVKITRAFYGGGNSTQIALIPDSSYFKTVDATVKEYVNGSLNRTFILHDTLIPNKEQGGAFYAPEQKVYYFKTDPLSPLVAQQGTVYKLEAKLNNGELLVEGETGLVGDMAITAPLIFSEYNFAKNPDGIYGFTTFGFNPGNAKKVELKLYIEFDEFVDTELRYTKSIEWKIGEVDADDIKQNQIISKDANGQTFYTLIAQNVTNDPEINKRKLKGVKILVNGASSDLQKYLLVNKPSSSLAQTKSNYTNLRVSNGHRVIGIFASRGYEERYKESVLNKNSRKELSIGSITGLLFFCSDNVIDQAESYYCD